MSTSENSSSQTNIFNVIQEQSEADLSTSKTSRSRSSSMIDPSSYDENLRSSCFSSAKRINEDRTETKFVQRKSVKTKTSSLCSNEKRLLPPPLNANKIFLINVSKKSGEMLGEFPPTPPTLNIEHRNFSSNHRSVNRDVEGRWSVPPTIDLSPNSLTSSSSSPDLSTGTLINEETYAEIELKKQTHRARADLVVNNRHRSLSTSCPTLGSVSGENSSKSLNRSTTARRKSSVQRSMKTECLSSTNKKNRRRRPQNEDSCSEKIIVRQLIDQIIENVAHSIEAQQIESQKTKKKVTRKKTADSAGQNLEKKETIKQNKSRKSNYPKTEENLLDRLKEIKSSESQGNMAEQKLRSKSPTKEQFERENSNFFDEKFNSERGHLLNEIINELVRGAKGLDRLSCSVSSLNQSMEKFTQLNIEKQIEKNRQLEQALEKICSNKVSRAVLFCKQRVDYFISKHSINSNDELVEQISCIVKYFYLFIFDLNVQKEKREREIALTEIVENPSKLDQSETISSTLTDIIENYILKSSFVDQYLGAQPIIIEQTQHDLPWIKNTDLENELLNNNQISLSNSLFVDLNDLEQYLNRCLNAPLTLSQPVAPIPNPTATNHQSTTSFYSNYYPTMPTNEYNSYYYPPMPMYPSVSHNNPYNYNSHSTGYCHRSTSFGNGSHPESMNYYYYSHAQQPSNSYMYSQSNSIHDIPVNNMNSFHHPYRPHSTHSRQESPFQ